MTISKALTIYTTSLLPAFVVLSSDFKVPLRAQEHVLVKLHL